MKNPKPEPVPVNVVCSLCGEGWTAHGADPTTLDCIRLLKAKVATRPYVIPYVQPYVVRPYWDYSYGSGTITCASGTTAINSTASTVTWNTPREDNGPEPVAA